MKGMNEEAIVDVLRTEPAT